MPTYTVRLTRKATFRQSTTLEIEAGTENEAKQKALHLIGGDSYTPEAEFTNDEMTDWTRPTAKLLEAWPKVKGGK